MKDKLKKFYADHKETIELVGAFAAVAGGSFTVGFIYAALSMPEENEIEDIRLYENPKNPDVRPLQIDYSNGTTATFLIAMDSE